MENIFNIVFTFIEGLKNNTLSEEVIYNINIDLIVALIEVEKSSLELKEISYICLVTTNYQNKTIGHIQCLIRNSLMLAEAMVLLRDTKIEEIEQKLVKYNNLINIDQRTFNRDRRTFLEEIRRIINNVYENHTRATLNFSRMMRNTGRANDNEIHNE